MPLSLKVPSVHKGEGEPKQRTHLPYINSIFNGTKNPPDGAIISSTDNDDVETIVVVLLLLDFFRTKPAITAEWMTDGGTDGRRDRWTKAEGGKGDSRLSGQQARASHTQSRAPEKTRRKCPY